MNGVNARYFEDKVSCKFPSFDGKTSTIQLDLPKATIIQYEYFYSPKKFSNQGLVVEVVNKVILGSEGLVSMLDWFGIDKFSELV